MVKKARMMRPKRAAKVAHPVNKRDVAAHVVIGHAVAVAVSVVQAAAAAVTIIVSHVRTVWAAEMVAMLPVVRVAAKSICAATVDHEVPDDSIVAVAISVADVVVAAAAAVDRVVHVATTKVANSSRAVVVMCRKVVGMISVRLCHVVVEINVPDEHRVER